MIFPAIMGGLSAASSIGGMFGAKKAAERNLKETRLAQLIRGTAYTPVGVSGPGGIGVSFGGAGGGGSVPGDSFSGAGFGAPAGEHILANKGKFLIRSAGNGFRQVGRGKSSTYQSDIGNIGLSLGDLTGGRDDLANFFNMQAGGLGSFDDPFGGGGLAQSGLAQALSSQGGLDALSGLVGQGTGQSFQDLQRARGFQDPLQAGILQAVQDSAVTGQQATDRTLGLLREQAQPFEQRAFNNLNQNLFSTGRMGTSGGGLQTEAFARGLGQADITRQLQASEEGRRAQTQALNQATGLGGLQESLLSGAVNRFSGLADLSRQLSGQRFTQGQGMFDLGKSALQLPQIMQALQLGNLGGSQELLSGLQNMSMKPAELARQFMTDQANMRAGQGGSVERGAAAAAGPAAEQANLLSSLGSAFGQFGTPQDAFGALRGLFSRGGGGGGLDQQVTDYLGSI